MVVAATNVKDATDRWRVQMGDEGAASLTRKQQFFARAKYHQSLTVFGILLQPEAMDKTGDRASRGLTALPKPPS